MDRASLQRLTVKGPGMPDADIRFGAGLTLITGLSDTGKTHILQCLDFGLAGNEPPKAIPERSSYTEVLLELKTPRGLRTVARRLADPDNALVFEGSIDGWDGDTAHNVKVDLNPKSPNPTLSRLLLEYSGFDPSLPVVRNAQGVVNALSFRAVAPFALVTEEEIIRPASPVLPATYIEHTKARSVFNILLTGEAPDAKTVDALSKAAEERNRAKQQIEVLDRLMGELREEIDEAGFTKAQLKAELTSIDSELADVSELAARSGERVRDLLRARNASTEEREQARRRYLEARELLERFELLGQHYESDIERLQFVAEGGHFFQQLEASHCPRCGRALEPRQECHSEGAELVKIEHAAAAEIAKLEPRLKDLGEAVEDAAESKQAATKQWQTLRDRVKHLDSEIQEVANPDAATARQRVRKITARRTELSEHMLRFQQLERYTRLRDDAQAIAQRKTGEFRPAHAPSALSGFTKQVAQLLERWKFPFHTDLVFNADKTDIDIHGKPRADYGKGVRAVTHAAFTIGLMRYCIDADKPHPGFVAIDSPLTPFKGISDDEEDPTLSNDLRLAFLYDLATTKGRGQTVIIENVDAPDSIQDHATIYAFTGARNEGRQGFYPVAPALPS